MPEAMDIPRHDTPTLEILETDAVARLDVDRQQIAACLDLLRVAKRTLELFHRRFQAHDLSPGRYSVLMELVAAPPDRPLTPSQVARRIGLSRPSLTSLVEGLARDGLVERRTDPLDRRRIELRLTAEGRTFLERFLPGQMRAMASVVSDLSPTQLARFRRALGVVESNLEHSRRDLP